MMLQESNQVDSSSGGSLVLIRPQDVVTDDCNRIDSNLYSAQTVDINSSICETEGRTPPVGSFKQGNEGNGSVLPAAIESAVERSAKHDDVGIDEWSHVFQETTLPLFDHSLANTDAVIVDQQQVTKDKEDSSLVEQCLSVDQGKQSANEDSQSKVSIDCDLLPMDIDMQSINQPVDQDKEVVDQDKEPIDQDEETAGQDCQEAHSLGQNSEDDENPFSHLLLFSDNDNDAVPQTTSKKKQRRAKSKPHTGDKRKKTDRKIPDSFVAVRFSSPELRHKLGLVQQHMVEMDKKLQPTLIPLVKLHITLITLQLNNDASLTDK